MHTCGIASMLVFLLHCRRVASLSLPVPVSLAASASACACLALRAREAWAIQVLGNTLNTLHATGGCGGAFATCR